MLGLRLEGTEELLILPPLVIPLGLGTFFMFKSLLIMGSSHWRIVGMENSVSPWPFSLADVTYHVIKKQTPPKTTYLLHSLTQG